MSFMWRWWTMAFVLGAVCLLVGTTASPAAAEAVATPAPGPVVVVGVPDLRWQDVNPTDTPALWQLAGASSIAALTDRSAAGDARRATGWVTLNTGSRALAHVPPGAVPDPGVPEQLDALRASNRASSYGAEVGALGDALHQAGHTVAVVGGPGATLGATSGDGTVDARAPSVAAALEHADVVVVELPQLYPVDRTDPAALHAALAAVDSDIRTAAQELPTNGSLLVAGVSEDALGPAHLHVALATGPSFGTGRLTSASTGRTGVVQLIDVAPTVLWLTGTPVPSSMLGVHWVAVPEPGASTAERVSAFIDLDRRSRTELDAESWYYPAIGWTALLFAAATGVAWWRRRTGVLRPLGAVVASVPAANWLAQLVPWWRVGTWPLAPLTLGFASAIGLTAVASWSRRDPWRTAGLVGAVTAAVITADAVTGSPLSLDAPFGDNPIVAGRFHGLGNVAFAMLGAGTLLLCAALAVRLAGLSPRRAALTVLCVGAAAVVVDGHPALGDDFGGVLALMPAVALLGLVVSRVRISVRHSVAVLLVTVLTTASFALYDYSRAASERTHLGRFVGQLVEGSAGQVVGRKLGASLASFSWGWQRWIVLGWVVLAVVTAVCIHRGWLRVPVRYDHRTLIGLVASLFVLGFLGAALNDSGLGIPAFAFYVAGPLLVAMVEPAPRAVLPARPQPDLEVAGPGLRRP